MNPFIGVLIIMALAGIITLAMLAMSVFLGPRNMRNPVKGEPFECGMPSEGVKQFRFPVKFYVVAILFIVFDLELVFIYPWAVIFRDLGMFGFIEMMIFVFVLAVGLIYIWKKGALEWK
ncbi:NADH-quinone oxidoreductase subunit A [bacterium]|nr:NADH-quinone oxidoreductase subunit A [bacterium]